MMEPAPASPPEPHVRRRFEEQRTADTKPEVALRSELHRRGLRFRKDRQVVPGSRRRHDIVFGPARVVVEVRGCYWHGCPEHFVPPKRNAAFWAEKIEANRRRDADTRRLLEDAGWHLVEVWEHEAPTVAADRIEAVLRAGR